MSKIKAWIINKFLPAWCKDTLMRENQALARKNQQQAQEIAQLRAYIDGLEYAVKRRTQIVVNKGDCK